MKTLACLLSGICVLLSAGCVGAEPAYIEQPVPVSMVQPPPPIPPPDAPTPPTAQNAAVAAPSAAIQPLDQLVAPIALYPDPLVALLLPASTVSSDIVLAARYFTGGGDPQQIDAQTWDESVKGLAHYPEVVKWMDENLAWTQQLGAAYLDSPGNVMAAIQRVRVQARAKGLLVDSPQQQVVMEDDALAIVPTQPDVIYVPRYDPEIIFVDRPSYYYENDPWMTFGLGFGVGWWLSYDFDWHRRVIWIDHRSRDHWRGRHEWRQPYFPGGGGPARGPDWQPWRPSPGRPRPPQHDFDRNRRPMPRPAPMPGTPHRQPERPGQPPRMHDGNPAPHAPGENRHSSPTRPNDPPRVQPPRADRVPPAAERGPNQPPRRETGHQRPERRDEPTAPATHVGRPDPTPQSQPPTVGTPQPRPRLSPPSGRPADRVPPAAPTADRVPPPAQSSRPSVPAADRTQVRAPAPVDQRQFAPPVPRQDRAERAPRPAPAPREKPADTGNRGGDDRDKRDQQN